MTRERCSRPGAAHPQDSHTCTDRGAPGPPGSPAPRPVCPPTRRGLAGGGDVGCGPAGWAGPWRAYLSPAPAAPLTQPCPHHRRQPPARSPATGAGLREATPLATDAPCGGAPRLRSAFGAVTAHLLPRVWRPCPHPSSVCLLFATSPIAAFGCISFHICLSCPLNLFPLYPFFPHSVDTNVCQTSGPQAKNTMVSRADKPTALRSLEM